MSAKPPGTVSIERVGGRATVTWDRPPANIFDTPLLEELSRVLRGSEIADARIVVLRGAGKGWSGGLAVQDHLKPRVARMFDAFHETLTALWNLPVPTIAQVHGNCLGGGMELMMACDLAIASERALFGQPEIRLGVFAPFGVATYIGRLGARKAAELLYLGAPLDAAHAASAGIINRAVPEEELEASVALTAETLSSHRPSTLRLMKRVLRRTDVDPWPHVEVAERAYLDELMSSDDAEEGLRAFLEKRTPVWRET
ncbi:MAG TPA: enoyl-CoA hydratase/isomerase family protein [Thermoplasmata archaeon]|nr:enoyl-CoA hydratase/isomerase family protein [Thermoplasmata archaeon]